jgi:hypothetical protein
MRAGQDARNRRAVYSSFLFLHTHGVGPIFLRIHFVENSFSPTFAHIQKLTKNAFKNILFADQRRGFSQRGEQGPLGE